MTKREFYVQVMALEGCTDEMREVAEKGLAQLDKRASKPTKAQIENEGYKVEIADYLTEEPKEAKEIAEGVGLTVNKVAALLRQLVADGKAIKIEGKGKKSATYTVA